MRSILAALLLPAAASLTVGRQATCWNSAPKPDAARLTIVQVTDVYTLSNFPHLKSLLDEVKQTNPTTISMLTGDFLAPYLLSSIDKGHGMMRMINQTPIDYLTWGNHEADIDHKEVCTCGRTKERGSTPTCATTRRWRRSRSLT